MAVQAMVSLDGTMSSVGAEPSTRSGSKENVGHAFSKRSTQSLETPLDADLVRGVPLHFCLRGFGRIWKRSCTRDDYNLSRKTPVIDHFLSHDWNTSRYLKWMTLLVIFNAGPAACFTLLVSVVLSVFACFGYLGAEHLYWLPLPGFLTYVLVLLFWQDMRRAFRTPILAFVDKLCIAQHDMQLKEQGIRGLGSFLASSNTLTVLWSERYFSRLWCTYEVASYLEGERHKAIELIPVKMALLLLIASIQACSGFLMKYLTWLLDITEWLQDRVFVELVGHGGVFLPVALYVALGCMVHYFQLPQQLRHFRVQDTECHCCSNNHLHPETGEELICDRALVFGMLRKWFGASKGEKMKETYLDRFNALVHEKLSSQIAHTVGRGLPHLRYVLFTVCTAPVPFFPFIIALETAKLRQSEAAHTSHDDHYGHSHEEGHSYDDMYSFRWWVEHAMDFLVPPLYGVVSFLLMVQSCRLVYFLYNQFHRRYPMTPCRKVVLSLALTPVIWAILAFGVWELLVADVLEDEPVVKLILFISYLVITAGFFCAPSLCDGGTPSESMEDDAPPMTIEEQVENEIVSNNVSESMTVDRL